jgi:hypothetical protein
MVPRTLLADGVGGRRRMVLRPCAIGETGGYLEVADDPRPPVGAEQSAPKSLARSRLALPLAPSERNTGTHPPVGAGAAVDPGRFIPSLSGPAGIPPSRISALGAAASGQESGITRVLSLHVHDRVRRILRNGARDCKAQAVSLTVEAGLAAELGDAWSVER